MCITGIVVGVWVCVAGGIMIVDTGVNVSVYPVYICYLYQWKAVRGNLFGCCLLYAVLLYAILLCTCLACTSLFDLISVSQWWMVTLLIFISFSSRKTL